MADPLDILGAQAQAAVEQGADPDWVKQTFAKEAFRLGYDPDKVVFNYKKTDPNEVTPETKKEYKEAVRGGADEDVNVAENKLYTQPGLLADIQPKKKVKDSPLHPSFDDVKEEGDSTAAIPGWMAAGYGIQNTLQRGAAGLLGATEPLTAALGGQDMGDEQFAVARGLLNESRKNANLADGGFGAVGGAGANIIGSFLGDPMARGMDAIDEGKGLARAEGENLLGSAENEAYSVLGKPFAAIPGVKGYIGRALTQGAGALGITAADRKLEGEDLTNMDYGMAAGMGLFGGFFKEPPKTTKGKAKVDIPETSDAAFEAGKELGLSDEPHAFDFDAAFKRQQDLLDKQKSPQGDLFADNTVEQPDLFGGKSVPADVAEARRSEEAQRAPRDQAQLESDYLQDQQDKLQPFQTAEDVSAQKQTESGGNAAMAEAMQKAGLANEEKPQNFEPSRNETVEQPAPEQGQLPLTEDMFNQPPKPQTAYQARQARLAEQAKAAETPTEPQARNRVKEYNDAKPLLENGIAKAEAAGDKETADKLRNKLANLENAAKEYKKEPEPDVDLNEAIRKAEAEHREILESTGPSGIKTGDSFYSSEHVPEEWRTKAANNTLTVSHVLDHVISNTDGKWHPDIVNYAKVIRGLAQKFGGLDTKYKLFDDNDSSHASYLASRALKGKKKPPHGYFAPQDGGQIHINPVGGSVHTFLHEGTHAVTHKVIEAGNAGKLSGEAQAAFDRLKRLQKESIPIINELGVKSSSSDPVQAHHKTYGAGGSIHEFITELFTNPVFRQHLKSIPLSALEKGTNIARPISDRLRAGVGAIKNAYGAVIGNLAKMLGLSGKAENVLDVAIAGSKDFFNKVNPKETEPYGVKRALNAEAPKTEKLQRERGKIETGLRALLASKGIDPTVTQAGRRVAGENALGSAEAIHTANRINDVATDKNKADLNKALQGDIDSFNKLDKKAQNVVKDEWVRNADRLIEMGKALAKNPNLSQMDKRAIASLLKDAARTQGEITEASHIPGSMKAKWKLYEKANAKAKAGKALSPREMDAVHSVAIAEDYMRSQWLPKDLEGKDANQLRQLYRYHTGTNPDKALAHLEGEAKNDAMRAVIGDKIRGMANKDGAVENLVKASMDMGDKRNPLRQYYRAMRNNAMFGDDFHKLPKELHQLWEPISDPAARVAANLLTQKARTANAIGLQQLRDSGMGKLFTAEQGSKTHSEPLQGEKYGPLQGLWTTPDVKRAIDDTFGLIYLNHDLLDNIIADPAGSLAIGKKMFDLWKGMGSHLKGMSILWSPINYAFNAVGSPLQWISNGNWIPGKNHIKGIRDAARLIDVAGKKDMPEDLKDLFRYHLVEYSQIEDLKGTEHGNIIAGIMKNAAKADTPWEKYWQNIRKAKNEDRRTLQAMKEFYGAMDLHTKFANWYNELDFWKDYAKRNNTGETLEQIKQKVAERINDTNISPSLAPKFVKNMEGLTASFLPYYSEIARTLGYNLNYGMKDMKAGINKGDGQLIWHGAKRLAGMAAAMVGVGWGSTYVAKAISSATGLTATALTDDKDERTKYLKNDPFTSTQHPILLSDPQHPDAGEFTFDIGRADPYGPDTEILRTGYDALHAALTGDKQQAHDYADMMWNQAVNLFNRNAVWAALGGAVAGKKPQLANNDPDTYDQIRGWLTNNLDMNGKQADGMMMLAEKVNPSLIKNMAKATSSSPALDAGQKVSAINKLDVAKDVSNYLGPVSKDQITGSRNKYLDLMKQNYDNKPERVEEDFKQALVDASKPYEKLKDAVAAARAQGASRSEMIKRLKAADVGQDVTYAILHNKPLTPSMIDGDLSKDFQRDLIDAIDDPEKKAEAKKRFRTNTKLMHSLVKKYKDVPIEDLE